MRAFNKRRIRDRTVSGLSPGRSGEIKKKFSWVSFLCSPPFRYPLHSRVTAVAGKRSRSFCQKCKWRVTAKHTCTLRMRLRKQNDTVQLCLLCGGHRTCAETAPGSRGTSHVTNSAVATSVDIQSALCKATVVCSHSESHTTRTQWFCSDTENSAIVATEALRAHLEMTSSSLHIIIINIIIVT